MKRDMIPVEPILFIQTEYDSRNSQCLLWGLYQISAKHVMGNKNESRRPDLDASALGSSMLPPCSLHADRQQALVDLVHLVERNCLRTPLTVSESPLPCLIGHPPIFRNAERSLGGSLYICGDVETSPVSEFLGTLSTHPRTGP